MKNKLPYVFVGVILLSVVSYAQKCDVSENLALSMSSGRTSYLPMEPLSLKFSLENRSSKDMRIMRPIDTHSLKMIILHPTGDIRVANQLIGYSNCGFYALSSKTVKPGTTTWNELWEFNLAEYFWTAGEYRIQAIFNNGDEILTTNWVKIKIEEPSDDERRPYGQLLGVGKENILDGFYLLAQQKNRVAFIESFPDSRYSDYVRYFAAQGFEHSDRQKAIEYLQTIAAKRDFVLAEDAKKFLKRIGAPLRPD